MLNGAVGLQNIDLFDFIDSLNYVTKKDRDQWMRRHMYIVCFDDAITET